ncbi:hypothetical protein PG994_007172 [Apiospora phragmitis]|uniref:Uncharacterized protein n=1 Tax=Apiospora phragmitis TaxID=2905665 RepID=A0ABR1V373_9PEZI
MVRETARGIADAAAQTRRWFDIMEIGYWNALGAILICVFLGGSVVALRLLFTWNREEQEARRRERRRQRTLRRRRGTGRTW